MTAASGADQPTLREQLAEGLTGRWLSYGDDIGDDDLTEHKDRDGARITPAHARLLADVLLPLIEADRERAKAEGGAEALEQAAKAVESEYDHPMQEFDPDYYGGLLWAMDDLRDRAAALRGRTGGGT